MPKHKTVKARVSVRTAKDVIKSYWNSITTTPTDKRPPMKPPMKGDKKK